MPVLCDRTDVVVLTDEAHCSQYDTLALNMRAALPKALFLAFTGTPLNAIRKHKDPAKQDAALSAYSERQALDSAKLQELQRRLDVLKTIDMALVVSPGQNEVEQLRKHGLDIVPHRKRMNESQPPFALNWRISFA